MPLQTDVLIIGCGIAGATAALRLSKDTQRQITIVTRASEPEESNTFYAQGGIVTRGIDDSADLLVNDILEAGAGLSLASAARILADEGPQLVDEVLLETAGVPFDREDDGQLCYGMEAAHSSSRILHVGDATGKAIIRTLVAVLQQRPNVHIVTSATAVDLITFPHHATDPMAVYEPVACHGAYVYEPYHRAVHRYLAGTTILATGGLGRIYRHTTNPAGSRGDGLAMAYRAGARVINAEYVQFHPTALALSGGEGFLITEAVRGEGGKLRTPDGRAFMKQYAPEWQDLAPRDVVARASFLVADPVATEAAKDRARSRVRYVYAVDPQPLEQLRASLRNTVVEVTAAKPLGVEMKAVPLPLVVKLRPVVAPPESLHPPIVDDLEGDRTPVLVLDDELVGVGTRIQHQEPLPVIDGVVV